MLSAQETQLLGTTTTSIFTDSAKVLDIEKENTHSK